MNTEKLTALWEQLVQDPGSIWGQQTQHFQAMSTRIDGSSASAELTILLAGAFILGFLFCHVQGKAKR